jgi:hypothetical protein
MIPREARMALSMAALIVLLIFIVLALSWCSERERAGKASNAATMAEGRTTSAVEAINETGKLAERGQATDATVEDSQDAIRQADPADRDRVARARLCRLQQRTDCHRVQ